MEGPRGSLDGGVRGPDGQRGSIGTTRGSFNRGSPSRWASRPSRPTLPGLKDPSTVQEALDEFRKVLDREFKTLEGRLQLMSAADADRPLEGRRADDGRRRTIGSPRPSFGAAAGGTPRRAESRDALAETKRAAPPRSDTCDAPPLPGQNELLTPRPMGGERSSSRAGSARLTTASIDQGDAASGRASGRASARSSRKVCFAPAAGEDSFEKKDDPVVEMVTAVTSFEMTVPSAVKGKECLDVLSQSVPVSLTRTAFNGGNSTRSDDDSPKPGCRERPEIKRSFTAGSYTGQRLLVPGMSFEVPKNNFKAPPGGLQAHLKVSATEKNDAASRGSVCSLLSQSNAPLELRDAWVYKGSKRAAQHHCRSVWQRRDSSDEKERSYGKRRAMMSKLGLENTMIFTGLNHSGWKDCKNTVGRLNRKLVLHPQSSKKLVWDLLGVAAVAVDLIFTPLLFFDLKQTEILNVLNWMVNGFWTCDIFVSFRTGFLKEAKVVMEPRLIAWQYATGWLCFDMLVLLPEWITVVDGSSSPSGSVSVLRLAKLSRLMRLARLVKIKKLIYALQLRVNSNRVMHFLRVTMMILGVLATSHVIAGLWWWIGSDNHGWPTPALLDGSLMDKYFASLHWGITQLHGSMHISATNTLEHLFSAAVLPMCLVMVSLMVSTITTDLQQMKDFNKDVIAQKMVLCSFLERNRISQKTSARLKVWLEKAALNRQEQDDDQRLMELLPKHMQQELLVEVRSPSIMVHPFLSFMTLVFPRFVRELAYDAMGQDLPQIGDIIFGDTDACSVMRTVVRGLFQYRPPKACQDLIKFMPKHKQPRYSLTSGQPRSSRNSSNPFRNSFNGFRNSFNGPPMPRLSAMSMSRAISWNTSFGVDKTALEIEIDMTQGWWVSEIALWTPWENVGTLETIEDGVLLMLSSEKLVEMMERHNNHSLRSSLCTYASWFIRNINELPRQELSDIFVHPQTWRDDVAGNVGEVGRPSEASSKSSDEDSSS